MRLDAIFLDVGGVFQLPTAAAVLPVLELYGVALEEPHLRRCHYAGMAAYDRAPGGVEREWWQAYLRAYAHTAGVAGEAVPAAVPALLGAFRQAPKWATVIAESVQALRLLAATGVTLALVSNSDGTVQARLQQDGTCQVGAGPGVPVHAILDSHVVGVAKPDPRIFQLALDATRAQPERVLHVGDSVRADVRGAWAAGLVPLHLDPFGLCSDTDHEHIRGVADMLERL